MLRIKSIITDIRDIPKEWVYEFYLELPEKLTGQDLKIKSIFNPHDKTPSMYIYYSNAQYYKFKDFSTGKAGDPLELVCLLFNIKTRSEAALKVINDYNKYISIHGVGESTEIKAKTRYHMTGYNLRSWTNIDQNYWTKFNIGSEMLEAYNVKPFANYTLEKDEDGQLKQIVISNNSIYGFFRKDGKLYKIYQPFVKDYKFIKVADYTQGLDQLTLQKPYLIICSSLKDIMSFNSLGYNNAEAIAPDSENSIIPETTIIALKHKYKKICTLFDNDPAGIESMSKYTSKYGIPSVLLPLSKDLSDSVRDHGAPKVRHVLTPLLKEKLK